MRYVAEAIFVLAVVAMLIAFVWVAILRPTHRALTRRRRKSLDAMPWKVREHSDGMNTEVWLEHPTEKPIYIDEVSTHLPAWQHQEELEGIRVAAKQKADDKNRRLP